MQTQNEAKVCSSHVREDPRVFYSHKPSSENTDWLKRKGENALQPILSMHVLCSDIISQLICFDLKIQTQISSEKTNCPSNQCVKGYY